MVIGPDVVVDVDLGLPKGGELIPDFGGSAPRSQRRTAFDLGELWIKSGFRSVV